MSQPAKTETGSGWFSRFFGTSSNESLTEDKQSCSSSSSNNASPIQKKVENAKNLIKNFSTPNGTPRSVTVKTLKTLGSPVSIIQKAPIDKRKRQHLENGSPTGPVEDIFTQRQAKRYCGTANLSLVEEPIRITVPERLDITWAGDRLTDASPASSVRSLRSRLSGQASTASSGLSSKTRAILQQLERVHTPARESRRLPLVRNPTTISERWTTASAPLTAGSASEAGGAPPPLRKIRGGSSGPTRLQMLSNHLGFQKKTYLKDLHRPTMKERDEAVKAREEGNQNGSDLNGSRLCSIFEIPASRPSPKETPGEGRHHKVSVLKGTDGKSRNVFNTKGLEDDEEERNPLPLPSAVSLPMPTVPQKGFLGDLAFTFELPKDRFGTCNGSKTPPAVNTSFEQQDSSDNGESDTSETESGEISDVSGESTSSSPIPEEPKQKTPEKSKVPAVVITGPKETEKKKTWSCAGCWADNPDDKDTCPCCGHGKGAPAAVPEKKELPASSLFKPTTTTTETTSSFSFGVGSGSTATTGGTWSCSVCCVDNTADKDKCVCCETPKGSSGSSAPPAKKELVSNLSSFASTTPATVSFGFGSGPAAPAPTTATTTTEKPKETPTAPAFGFGSSTTAEKPKETAVPTFGVGAATIPSKLGFGMTASSSSPNLFGTATQNGAAKPLFGGLQPATTPAAAPAKPAEESWDCGACFIKSTGDKCIACGTPKDGSTAPAAAQKKELVSNLSSFAPSAPVKFGFGLSASSTPAATTTPAQSLTPPVPAAIPAEKKAQLSFGMAPSSSSPSIFDASKAENGAPAASTATTVPATLMFGTSTGSSLFGNTPAPTAAATEAPKPLFGGSAEAPKPLFGSTSPMFGKPTEPAVSESPKPLFGGSAATSKPLFGSTEAPKPLFGGLGSSEAPKLTFGTPATSTEAPKLSFGVPAATSEAPKPIFGSAPAPGSIFGQAPAVSSPFSGFGTSSNPPAPVFGAQPTAPVFGAPPDQAPTAKKPMFGGFNQPATGQQPSGGMFSSSGSGMFGNSNPAPASSTGFNFGAPAAAPTFGGPAPSMTTSASAGSLFAPTSDAPTSFNFGASAPAQSNQPFVFGQAAPSPFGSSAPAPGGGAFAYNATTASSTSSGLSAGARKIAQARRRMPGRR